MGWYLNTRADYAKALRYYAVQSDKQAERAAAENFAWSYIDVARSRHQARRLRAMALLCDRSTGATAGDIEFHGLHDPSNTREHEESIIEKIEVGEL